jgi:hypothetical protein
MEHVKIEDLVSAVPIPVVVKMSRSEKLHYWAVLVRECRWNVRMVHGLEYARQRDLDQAVIRHCAVQTALEIAISDPTLQAQGLSDRSTIGDALRFFELTQDQAHAFSCDCGGYINNGEQADRIERLA